MKSLNQNQLSVISGGGVKECLVGVAVASLLFGPGAGLIVGVGCAVQAI